MSQYPIKTMKSAPSAADNQSTALLIQSGYIRQELAGVYNYLPLGLKVLNNIKNIISKNLEQIGAQEIFMSALGSRDKWEKTGRDNIDILFKVPMSGSTDKYNVLNPTHEEIVTPLMQEFIKSYRDFPVAVFQTQTKFRNEKRAKSGILRGREFLMNDMYSFHADQNSLDDTYGKVIDIYKNIFKELGIGDSTYLTYASGGIFSKYSHEFQTLTEHGEDLIYLDKTKGIALNKEIVADVDVKNEFVGYNFEPHKASEVGNIFKLGTKFTDAFNVDYVDAGGDKRRVHMGCYGLGVSRTMGIVAEKFFDEKGLVWPANVAPYDFYLISIGDERIACEAKEIIEMIERSGKTVMYDDRNIGFGEKAKDSELLGIPNRIIVSKKTIEKGGFEYKQRTLEDSVFIVKENMINILK